MKHSRKELNAILDRTAQQIRSEEADASIVESAAQRVWARIAASPEEQQSSSAVGEAIRGCPDFVALIPEYLEGKLTGARALLLEDHARECIPCRRAVKLARAGEVDRITQAGAVERKQKVSGSWKWAVAATLLVALGVGSFIVFQLGSGDATVTLQAVNGAVYRVTDLESRPATLNDQIRAGEKIRTGRDSTAVVKLTDGSMVEMRERSEFSVSASPQGTTINLARGNIIVEAAKQRSRHLYVASNDALVAVTGTIFSVNHGTKGTRVSVVEGEVRVTSGGEERILHPGDQTTTTGNLESVSIAQEVSWSQKADQYARLLSDLTALRKEVAQKAPRIGVRYSSKFLNLLPERTVLFAAVPNLAESISESHRVMQERINQNVALREWWQKENGNSNQAELEKIMQIVRELGSHLGEEIVVAAEMGDDGRPNGPLVLGDLKTADGFREFVEKQVASVNAVKKSNLQVRFIEDPTTADATTDQNVEIFLWITEEFFAASPKLSLLRQLALARAGGANSFNRTAFHDRLTEIYKEGAGLVVAADLERIIAQLIKEDQQKPDGDKRVETFRELGLLNLKHFVVEQKDQDEKTHTQATLTFSEGRKGIASWLAAPGPMGALEFISPTANVAAAFVVKEPVTLLDDLLGYLSKVSPDVIKHINDLETKHGINLRNDIAAPLGGEYAFAIDGPILPTPSWKMVFEVYDQAKLQNTLERLVSEVNRYAEANGAPPLQMERTELSGRAYYSIKSSSAPMEFHYTFANGYLVAAPSRALVEVAVRYRESGFSLLRSSRFTSALPSDSNTNFSAVFYHDLAPLLEPLAKRLSDSQTASNLSDEQRKALTLLGSEQPPTLAYVYTREDRIVVGSDTDGGPFGIGPASLLGMPNSFAIQSVIEQAIRGKD